MVGEAVEEASLEAESDLEDVGEAACDACGLAEIGLDRSPVRVYRRPEILGVDVRIEVEGREIARGGADVERLEEVVHPGGGLHTETEAQALGLRGRVTAVAAAGHDVCLLRLEVEREESIHRRCECVRRRGRDAVAEYLDEPDPSTGIVDLGGHHGSIFGRTSRHPGGNIDRRNVERHRIRLQKATFRGGKSLPNCRVVPSE